MSDHTPDTIGVDISKAHLDVHRRSTGESALRSTWRRGSATAPRWWSTSPRGRGIGSSRRAWRRGYLWRGSTRCARRFAQAMGEGAKTDAVDARVLAAMGDAVELRRVEPRPPALRDLDELVTARDALVKDRNRQKHVRHALLKRQLKNRLTDPEADQGTTSDCRAGPRCSRPSPASARWSRPACSPTCRNSGASMARPADRRAPWTRESGRGRDAASSAAGAPGPGGWSTWPVRSQAVTDHRSGQ